MNKNFKKVGRKKWAFAAGHIPLQSTGKEPDFTSHDKIAVLNASNEDAYIQMTIFYNNDIPVAGYKIKVKANRMKKVRFNDLIDPLPLPLDTPYGFILKSNTEIVVQFSRAITSSRRVAGFCVVAHHK
jgi:hypothetical protein